MGLTMMNFYVIPAYPVKSDPCTRICLSLDFDDGFRHVCAVNVNRRTWRTSKAVNLGLSPKLAFEVAVGKLPRTAYCWGICDLANKWASLSNDERDAISLGMGAELHDCLMMIFTRMNDREMPCEESVKNGAFDELSHMFDLFYDLTKKPVDDPVLEPAIPEGITVRKKGMAARMLDAAGLTCFVNGGIYRLVQNQEKTYDNSRYALIEDDEGRWHYVNMKRLSLVETYMEPPT